MATELRKVTPDGKEAGTVSVSETVFDIAPNIHVMHQAVRRELANARQGSACTKTRSEVRGGGRKPWKQKGTGRARAGSIRSPLWVGGGVIFGPKPRDYSFNLPKRVRRLALRCTLSSVKEKIRVVESFTFLKEAKTKVVAAFLNSLFTPEQKSAKRPPKVLILADYKNPDNTNLLLSARNIQGVKISLPHNLSVRDLLDSDWVITTQQAIDEINERYADHG